MKKPKCKFIQRIEVREVNGKTVEKTIKDNCRFKGKVTSDVCLCCLINRNTIVLENGFNHLINKIQTLIDKVSED